LSKPGAVGYGPTTSFKFGRK